MTAAHPRNRTISPRIPAAPPRPPNRARGFSLLELLVVMSILVVLAAVALPSYGRYQVRAKTSELILALGPARTAMAEWVATRPGAESWPSSGTGIHLPKGRGRYVQSIRYRRSSDRAVAAAQVVGRIDELDITINHEGTIKDGLVEWRCTAAQDAWEWLPADCANAPSAGL